MKTIIFLCNKYTKRIYISAECRYIQNIIRIVYVIVSASSTSKSPLLTWLWLRVPQCPPTFRATKPLYDCMFSTVKRWRLDMRLHEG